MPGRVHHVCHECITAPVKVEIARFRGAGGVEEIHLVARPMDYAAFDVQVGWLHRGVAEVLAALGGNAQPVLLRYACSDVTNQVDRLMNDSRRGFGTAVAVSWVGQPPPPPAKVALWGYALLDPGGRLDSEIDGHTLTMRRGALQHLWSCRMGAPNGETVSAQTRELLTTYETELHRHGLSLADHLIRTWLFLRDIDADYGVMAEVRREFFAVRGLTPQTHYCASTGIGGLAVEPAARVALDAYAIGGVRPEQLTYLQAPNHLSRTDLYGVTFERGIAVAYRDRRQVFISGTASIDDRGRLLHPGDATRQLDRTLENIEALLAEAGAASADLCTLVAYVRDPTDAELVRREIRDRFGHVPLLVVTAAVCRPAWLVEVEGQAVVAADADLPTF